MTDDSFYCAVVGQEDQVSKLRAAADSPVHAFLLLGVPGSGPLAAAYGFAAQLLSDGLTGPAAERARTLALAGSHPDLITIEAEGAALRVPEAERVIATASTSPIEGSRKVIIIHGIDAIEEEAVGKMLKIIEEPPASTFLVALAGELTPDLTTIASRCVTVEFSPLTRSAIEARLVDEGAEPERASLAAAAAGGDLDRARLLATDDAIAERAALWRDLPDQLDGTGSSVNELTRRIQAAMDGAAEPLKVRHAHELEDLDRRAEELGERGLGRSTIIARHKRELRKLRTDELRFGLATLARTFRDRLLNGPDPEAERALERTHHTARELVRNPNETLLLQALLLDLHR